MDLPRSMALSEDETEDLKKLEESLWLPETRFSQDEDGGDFGRRILGFGRSGRIYDKHVAIRTPSPIALVTRQSSLRGPDGTFRHALRSSVWTRSDRKWRLIFHQGTPIQRP